MKKIPNITGYLVTRDGRVWSSPKPNGRRYKGRRFLTAILNSKGYYRVRLWGKWYLVHRLVAKVYLKPVRGKRQVNHRNGVKTDNRDKNLEWCNASENHKHAYRIGTHKPRGRTLKVNQKTI